MDRWYLRSYKDGDAHYGHAGGDIDDDGMVTARCGLTFRPQQQLFGAGPAFVRPPVDALQACPGCRAAQSTAGTDREPDPDGSAVLGLIETLNSPRKKRNRT
ncbi:MAG: hypothetical protein ACRDQU_12480 [Pseudonocardiaceae bacterium]